MRSEVEEDRGRADHPIRVGIFGDKNERIVREDGTLQPQFVVEFTMRIVGAVDGEKNLANLADVLFPRFSDTNHDSPARAIRNGRIVL